VIASGEGVTEFTKLPVIPSLLIKVIVVSKSVFSGKFLVRGK
jgi:hypothetical protein